MYKNLKTRKTEIERNRGGAPQLLADLLAKHVPDLFSDKPGLLQEVYRATGGERFLVEHAKRAQDVEREARK